MKTKIYIKVFLIGVLLLIFSFLYLIFIRIGDGFGFLFFPGFICTAGCIAAGLSEKIYGSMYKGKSEPKVLFWIMLVMGVILLVVGLYFWIIVAGIPYQDPTEEMQKKWEFYLKLGEKILFFGMVLLSGGIVGNAVNFKNKRNGVKEND